MIRSIRGIWGTVSDLVDGTIDAVEARNRVTAQAEREGARFDELVTMDLGQQIAWLADEWRAERGEVAAQWGQS